MKAYLNLLQDVLDNGIDKEDRTGTGTRSVFGRQLRFDLRSSGFPLVTTKRVHWKSVVHELLWFISGSTNVGYLQENGVRIWNEWADARGELGPVYGSQWRAWPDDDPHDDQAPAVDQLAMTIDEIKSDPDSRRLIVSAWNVAQLPEMKLPPCHLLYQFYVAKGELSCSMYIRSCDLFLGLPFNIASYGLLLRMVAQVCDLVPGELVISFGDAHIYRNHFEQARLQLTRAPRTLPSVSLSPDVRCIDDFRFEHVRLDGYDPHPSIAAEISV